MSEDFPAVLGPAKTVQLIQSGEEENLILALQVGAQSAAGILNAEQAANIGLTALDWISRKTQSAEKTMEQRPITAHHLVFQPSERPGHIVLAADLGAATVRFELSHAALGEALSQLNVTPGKPPSAH